MATILGIDTSETVISVALARDGKLMAEHIAEERRTAEQLIPALQACFAAAGISPREVTGIAVTLGPGSFTGIRTGVATAQGLASALNLPVLGVSTLLARICGLNRKPRIVIGTLKSYDNEVYCTAVEFNSDGSIAVLHGPSVASAADLDQLRSRLQSEAGKEAEVVILDGPAFSAFSGAFAATRLFDAEIAGSGIQLKKTEAGLGLEPIYGKAVQAKTLAERSKVSG